VLPNIQLQGSNIGAASSHTVKQSSNMAKLSIHSNKFTQPIAEILSGAVLDKKSSVQVHSPKSLAIYAGIASALGQNR
jgi:hypothetical protein